MGAPALPARPTRAGARSAMWQMSSGPARSAMPAARWLPRVADMNPSPHKEPLMFNNTSAFALVSAVIGAGAYAKPLPATPHSQVPLQAVESIQRARVAIYCGHPQQAVSDIRAAGQQLRASGAPVSRETLSALD